MAQQLDTPHHSLPLGRRLHNAAGLWFELLSHGGLRRAGLGDDVLGLFVGSEVEAPWANLWLRWSGGDGRGLQLLPLLGPDSGARLQAPSAAEQDGLGATVVGESQGLRWCVHLRLAEDHAQWCWHVQLHNQRGQAVQAQLVQLQDMALAAYGALRLNEHYVSHYVDLTPLQHSTQGTVLAARQNLAVGGRHPWALLGSLRHGEAWATDALQVQGLAARQGLPPVGLLQGLPSQRLQHEHAAVALQDQAFTLAPGAQQWAGFFGHLQADHPAATGAVDLAVVDTFMCQPLVCPPADAGDGPPVSTTAASAASLFTQAPWLVCEPLDEQQLNSLFGLQRRHAEHGDDGRLLSFFCEDDRHVVLAAKETLVLRPHGHILRGGAALVPDETALTSTVWMGGVFHAMLTQGHVSLNRLLSTTRSYLGLFRSAGQRLFVQQQGQWLQLGLPSAFEITPQACRWFYRHAGGLFVVRSAAEDGALTLQLRVLQGEALVLRSTCHLALAGDDGCPPLQETEVAPPPLWQLEDGAVRLQPPAGSELERRCPAGSFWLQAQPGSLFTQVSDDAALYADGLSRGQPFVCVDAVAAPAFGLRWTGCLVPAEGLPAPAAPLHAPRWTAPAASALEPAAARLATALPWYLHNALVHYLAPRGLEQYSGGGWGTRDVCQGPLELLLAAGRTAPVRDLLQRTFAAQNADGDWPQWFMFFERDRAIRAGDSHGDIVFWPLLGLARYLLASGDAAFLDQPLPFHDAPAAPLWAHVQRALAVVQGRRIPGTALAAYGHGDWNDALQPAEPALRERLCSAWTVTLHHQAVHTLGQALCRVGRPAEGQALLAQAQAVREAFNRLLVVDGQVTGYALFPATPPASGQEPRPEALLLHPQDHSTGLHHSLLPLMHAVLEDLLPPATAQAQLALVQQHLLAPDGARLFDAPMPYRGGPERFFQRAESSAYFGREIGVMYMHAHLRWAETLAHAGQAQAFFDALQRAHPVALQAVLPQATRRQANCYYSSSDANFSDRYQAQAQYAQVGRGEVALEGGWRVYSSGPGIALGLVMRHVVGVALEFDTLVFDPVLPAALDGLVAQAEWGARRFELHYRVGAAGCGVQTLLLNGQALDFERRPNPLRLGAAAVPRSLFERLCTAGDNRLHITLG